MTPGLVPCSPTMALMRMLALVGDPHPYVLGTGDFHPGGPDVPWTARDGMTGSDCAGAAICYAYQLVRHRPGFNRGGWATVSDDLNVNSCIEDARHKRELWRELAEGEPLKLGDLLCYPTIRIAGHPQPFIGHVAMVAEVHPGWTWRDWSSLPIVDCHGGDGRRPAITTGTGRAFSHHDENWHKPEHRSCVLRLASS